MRAIIVHGGAGDAKKAEEIPVRVEVVKESAMKRYSLLKNSSSAIDAVVHAVKILENHPLFDAGRGSYLNEEGEGEVEMDAGIIEGDTLFIGAMPG
jgi:beta-aspartyl-peptidase (threonine type)